MNPKSKFFIFLAFIACLTALSCNADGSARNDDAGGTLIVEIYTDDTALDTPAPLIGIPDSCITYREASPKDSATVREIVSTYLNRKR